jgi:uncharacterized protein
MNDCYKGKTILLIGARQVGKTTLLRELIKQINKPSIWLNADEGDILNALNNAITSTELMQIIGPATKLVIIDEAQRIENIGIKLKLLHDTFPGLQVIATGSSAFDLQNSANESMTGRKKVFELFPISYSEIVNHTSYLDAKRTLEHQLVYGHYPAVVSNPGSEKATLTEIINSYLYKDILSIDGIRKSSYVQKLVQALAFQVGSEVNAHELSKTIGNISSTTIENYLDLLEKAYIIFKLPALSRNLRNELKRGKKYYFYDNGIRNAVISNYSQIDLRTDKGALWENFIISERKKMNAYNDNYGNTYFWRTHDQAEIDYIEEIDGTINVYEMKYKDQKFKIPSSFIGAYPQHIIHPLVSKSNFESFVGL